MNLLLLAVVLLQAPAPAGSIRGIILTDAGVPADGARVELRGNPEGPLVTRTDAEGRFVFANLPPGGYRLSVKKEGFVRQEYRQKEPGGANTPILVESGKEISGIAMRLRPAGTIAGEVRNEDGFPIANILVQALRRGYDVRGNRAITLFSNTLTDDLGAYRLYWVDPGDYYLNASYLPQLPTPVNANEDVGRAAYAPSYFPGTSDPAEAEAIYVQSGDVRRVDFRLKRSPMVTVSGTVYSITNGGMRARVELMAAAESASSIRYVTETDSKGVFEMRGISAGTYLLTATTLSPEVQTGYSKIEVLDIDRPRADVVVGPGVSVPVRLFGEVPASMDFSSIRVALLPLESHIPAPDSAVVQPNGALVMTKIQPSDYALRVSGLPANSYVRAASFGQQDVLEEFVSVHHNNPAPLDLQLAFDGGQINGGAIDAAGEAVDEATVVLVPAVELRRRLDLYRVVKANAAGRFSITGIPPGTYKLFAWDSVDTNAWLNAFFMSTYEQSGAELTVSANAVITSQIGVISQAH